MDETKGYYTPASKKASEKYHKEKLEQVVFWVKKGEKDAIKTAAKEHGMSMKRFIAQAVNTMAGKQLISLQDNDDEEDRTNQDQ